MTDVRDRIALVTGAASGIGRSLVLELARRGAVVVAWDLDEARLGAVVDELRGVGARRAHGYACDVSDADAVYRTAERVRREVGDVEVLVHNAGVVNGARLPELPDPAIRRTFEVNALALFWVTKAFLPAMVASGRGHVVTVASAGGLVGVDRETDYSASKHAAVGFTEALHSELRRTAPGVVTTVVCPFYVDTGMFRGVRSRIPVLLPVLRTERVATAIADAIGRDRRRLLMPPIVRLLPLLHTLPPAVFDRLLDLFGVNEAMDHFVGRERTAPPPARDRPQPGTRDGDAGSGAGSSERGD